MKDYFSLVERGITGGWVCHKPVVKLNRDVSDYNEKQKNMRENKRMGLGWFFSQMGYKHIA